MIVDLDNILGAADKQLNCHSLTSEYLYRTNIFGRVLPDSSRARLSAFCVEMNSLDVDMFGMGRYIMNIKGKIKYGP